MYVIGECVGLEGIEKELGFEFMAFEDIKLIFTTTNQGVFFNSKLIHYAG